VTTFAGLALLLNLLTTGAVSAAVFQFSVPVATAKGDSQSFLWIPPGARQVRGVVMAGMTLMEREFMKDDVIRKACADEQIALLFLKCGLSAADPQRVLDDLAAISGYGELASAPLLFVGHSAGGPQAKDCAIKFTSRCFGVVQYRGGVPGGSNAVPPGIPALMMLGQFDEFGGTMRDETGRESWEGGRDALAAYRTANESNLGSVVVEPGAGHFAWSARNAAYLALFIRKAAQTRIPGDWADKTQLQVQQGSKNRTAPALREISPASGWLTDLAFKNGGQFKPAPYDEYAGPKTNAAWHFDREMAEATLAYHAAGRRTATVRKRFEAGSVADVRGSVDAGGLGKRDQFIRWSDPVWVDAGARFFFTQIHWTGDGQTFEVHPVYAEKFPGQHDGKGPRWVEAGKPAGHAAGPILVKPVAGPEIAAGTNRLRIQFDALAPATEGGRVTFMAFSEGDAEYRYTEQVGMMPRGFSGFKNGRPQKISFLPLLNLKAGADPVKLVATSDAKLPVEFYVAHGPAVIEGGALKISELPARAKFPVAIKVVAWQFGRGLDPLVQTATPVEQIIQLER
jgi:hypothetical protein